MRRQNGSHLVDAIYTCIFLNENIGISLKSLIKFISKVSVDNSSVLVQVMTWSQTEDKPLPKPMMTQLNDTDMHCLSSFLWLYVWNRDVMARDVYKS